MHPESQELAAILLTDVKSEKCFTSKTLKSIGNSVFTDTAITSIQLPSGLKSIGAYAFYRCKLTSLNIPESVTMIDEYALSYCDNLAFVSVTGSVKEIPESLFEGDKKLKKVTLKQGVKKIGRNAFCGSGLTSMTFPESLTDIESQAFSLCPNLAKVTFPGKLTEIGSSAFYACRKLSAVTIPTSVKRIGTEAFNDCRAMKKIIFLNGKTILDGKPMGYNWENEKNRALVIVGKKRFYSTDLCEEKRTQISGQCSSDKNNETYRRSEDKDFIQRKNLHHQGSGDTEEHR